MTDPLPHRRGATRACLRWLLIGSVLAGAGLAHAATARQLCRFPDGERRVVYQTLGSGFRLAVDNCEALPALADDGPPEPEVTFLPQAAEAEAMRDTEIRVAMLRDTEIVPPAIREIVAPAARAPRAVAVAVAVPTSLTSDAPAEYQRLIASAARNHNIDPQIVEAVMYVESRFRADARSNKGALGLMQLMPQTAQGRCGVSSARLFEPAVNIECGVRYLGELSATFAGRIDLALAAYNAGPGAVMRHGWRVPPFAETEAYVARVLQRIRSAR